MGGHEGEWVGRRWCCVVVVDEWDGDLWGVGEDREIWSETKCREGVFGAKGKGCGVWENNEGGEVT
jgi:hypothetical protein